MLQNRPVPDLNDMVFGERVSSSCRRGVCAILKKVSDILHGMRALEQEVYILLSVIEHTET